MKKEQWKEKIGGVVVFGVVLYILSSRLGHFGGGYIFLAFIVGCVLILIMGNKHLGGKKVSEDEEQNEEVIQFESNPSGNQWWAKILLGIIVIWVVGVILLLCGLITI